MGGKVKLTISDNELVIDGIEMKPYWKRWLYALCWWKQPVFVVRFDSLEMKG
jgi:hypothetical protein